ncbi:MAG TPA: hypothetical protein VK943_17860 [Arenibaculum sp.]|nr:hypothetical protein [Arenibaculum sp.]
MRLGIIDGIVVQVQEGRFRLLGDDGRYRLFVLRHDAPMEPQDLAALQHRQAHVRVRYSAAQALIAGIAHEVSPTGQARASREETDAPDPPPYRPPRREVPA